uniref:Glycosyl hydrolase family 32 N-terminal domain-containing protein n=1 Tax=Roseihalotalea indica TaxID=2867963 RepID=A0AA49GNE3_9BACT|nr:hypothetical protein K4G66_31930 [Tunicatimonas sp. TK19036]
MFDFEKVGLIFSVDNLVYDWAKSHTALPTPYLFNSDTLRIFYTTRDEDQRSRISFIDVEKNNPLKVKYIHDKPILTLGKLGTYDDRGHTSSQVVYKEEEDKYLLFINGYNTANTARYRVGFGYAESEDLYHFTKPYEGPVIDRSIYSPCGAATPFILKEGKVYKMWYASFSKWEVINDIPEPFYCIKYGESEDLLNWKFYMEPTINLDKDEGGLVRPSVVKLNEQYHMFFSVRKKTDYRHGDKNSYRIGYASSKDGKTWQRHDNMLKLSLSESGWDSEMMAYPYAITVDSDLLLFYNGNGFGQSGFGLIKCRI